MLKGPSKKITLFIIGFAVLISGITLVLMWWKDVVILFHGAIGMILALAGMIILYMMKEA